ERRGLPQLLGDPLVRGRAGHAEVHDAPRAEFADEGGEERPEERIMGLEEIAGPDVLGVIAEEGRPGLPPGAWGPPPPHVSLHGAFRDRDAELEQLAPDPLGTPQPVVGCDPRDQLDRLGWDLRLVRPRARFPPPEQAQALPMPPEHGLRPDD